MILAALDGGKTKTVCIVFDENGHLISSSSTGPSGILLPQDVVKRNIWNALTEALAKAGLTLRSVGVLALSLADIDTKRDRERAWSIVKAFSIPSNVKVVVEHDAVAAYYAVTYGSPGVAVIAGTGSIAFGMNNRGERARAGGWGWLLGDEGSAYWIAKEGLQAAARAADGRGLKTRLLEKFMEKFKLEEPIDLIEAVYRVMRCDPTEIASLAVFVDEAAEEGDELAVEILRKGGFELAKACQAVVSRLKMGDSPIIVGGVGAVFNSRILSESFRIWVKRWFKKAKVKPPLTGYQPLVGLAVMCLTRSNLDNPLKRVEKLREDLNRIKPV